MEAEDYFKLSKRGDLKFASGIMGISYNLFLSTEAGSFNKKIEVTELLTWRDEKREEKSQTVLYCGFSEFHQIRCA